MARVGDRIRPGSRGLWLNQSVLGAIPDTLLSASNVVPRGPGKLASFPGYGAGGSGGLLSLTGAATMMPVYNTSGGLTTGSIVTFRGSASDPSYWFIGSGSVVVGTSSLGSASSSLTFRLGTGGVNTTAGLTRPAAPTLATAGAGNMTGTHSLKVAWVRSSTGAVSNGSEASASVSASSNRFQLTVTNVPAGVDRVRVYACRRGFSTTGPWYFLSEETVTPGAATFTIPFSALGPFNNGQWADGDLGTETPPIDYDIPPTGTHCCALGGVMIVLGCYGGAGVSPSYPTRPEAFPPDRVVFLPGPVMGIAPRSTDGFAYVWGTNYLSALVLAPGGYVIPRGLWSSIGFGNPDAACLVESELWGYTSEPVRTTQAGDPDTSFGLPVRDYMRANWNPASVVVGYSPYDNAVVYFHNTEALAYYRAADAWSGILSTPGTVAAAVTVGNNLYVSTGSGTMSAYGRGSGTVWSAQTEWRDAGAPGDIKTIMRVSALVEGQVTVGFRKNFATTNAQSVTTGASSAVAQRTLLSMNENDVTHYAFNFNGSGLQSVFDVSVDEAYTREAFI